MEETILNIYLVIENKLVTGFRALSYSHEGADEAKVNFLRSRALEDFPVSYKFNAPVDNSGNYMTWKSYEKLRKRNMEIHFFEEIFGEFNVSKEPLILVTPVIDGVVKSA